MAIYCTLLRMASLLVNLLCNTVVPVVENIANKFRIGGCPCPQTLLSPEIEFRGKAKRKKVRNGEAVTENDHGKVVKKIKLLLDITVRENGGETPQVEIQEKARYVDVEEGNTCGFLVSLFNMPSSIVLYITSKLRRWAHDLDSLENNACGGCISDRLKKSPKRRITRSNYRKIIPFFPFNLLGFSNYSAFQMPTLTHCGKPENEKNNLNVSTVSGRYKRPRGSSVSASDDNFSDFEEIVESTNQHQVNGHDEVDSDESADTVTKRVTSSSSNNGSSPKKNIAVNGADSDTSGSGGHEGVVSREFVEELDREAAKDYNSDEDPEYIPPEHLGSSTTESSYNTDSVSDESFNVSSRHEEETGSHVSFSSAVEATTVNESSNRKSVPSLPLNEANGHSNQNGHYNYDVGGEDDYKTPEEEELEIVVSTKMNE